MAYDHVFNFDSFALSPSGFPYKSPLIESTRKLDEQFIPAKISVEPFNSLLGAISFVSLINESDFSFFSSPPIAICEYALKDMNDKRNKEE